MFSVGILHNQHSGTVEVENTWGFEVVYAFCLDAFVYLYVLCLVFLRLDRCEKIHIRNNSVFAATAFVFVKLKDIMSRSNS